MSIVKSFSVGEGDMYYIKHGSDNFSVIDCCIDDDNKERIVSEIKDVSSSKDLHRFISTHPDEDHIMGLSYLHEQWNIYNFYSVVNKAKKDDPSDSFDLYCELRDSDKLRSLYDGVSRTWMNKSDEERKHAGLHCIWPQTSNDDYKDQLDKVKQGNSPNNISPMFYYHTSALFMWMGDIEKDFHEKVKDEISYPEIDVLFAPHHGRESGKVPSDVLTKLNPQIVVIGEAPSKNLNYYQGYNTITQNSAKDITFDVDTDYVHVYVSSSGYSVDFLDNKNKKSYTNKYYIGSFQIRES